MITIDTLRADHVSCYGPSPVETPHLDGLAKRGARMARAWTAVPLTTPAHATIFTGLYPPAHGVRNNARFRLPEAVVTLAEAVKPAGLATAAFVASFTTTRETGLDQGFDVYDDDLGNTEKGSQRLQRPGNEVVDRASVWLAANGGKPFFLWVHLFDPHYPYAPPPEWRAKFASDPYSGDVAFTDAQVGRLLAVLEQSGAAPRTVVAALADHGEGLGDHGEAQHGVLLYEESLRVPFALVAPGRIEPGTVVQDVAATVDVTPTVLGLLGIPSPPGVQGRNLLETAPPRRLVYAETLYPHEDFGWSALYAVRDGDLKYVESPSPELFDLGGDAKEARNLAEARRQDARRLSAALLAEAQRIVRPEILVKATGVGEAPDPEALARLAALGYLAGGGSGRPADALPAVGGRNPREAMADYEQMNRALELLNEEGFEEAARLLEAVTVSDPANPQARLKLAQALNGAGNARKAEACYRDLIRRHPTFYLAYRYLSDLLERADRAKEARELWLQLGRLVPGTYDLEVRLAQVETSAGMPEEAARRMQAYLEGHEQDGAGWTQLGRALAALGQGDEALEAYRYALDIRPNFGDAVAGTVDVLVASGRKVEALRLLRERLSRSPRDPFLRGLLQEMGAPVEGVAVR